MQLTPSQRDTVKQELSGSYDRPGLELLLSDVFGKRLDAYAAESLPFPTVLDRLVQGAAREGWLADLLEATARDRPRNAGLNALVAELRAALRPGERLEWGAAASPPADPPISTPPPAHTIPAPVADFTGRGDDIAALVAHLTDGGGIANGSIAAITGVHGMGGIGKTQLALKVAAALRDRYPLQFLFECQPGGAPLAADALLSAVIHALQPEQRLPDGVPALQAIYADALAGRAGLLVLDNAADGAQVDPLLPPPDGWAVIVTSRPSLPLDAALLHNLELLPLPEAVGLLARMLEKGGRRDAAEADLAPLAVLCGRLPLALRLAAGYLNTYRNWTLPRYLDALRAQRLPRLTPPGKVPIATVLGYSVSRLAETDAPLARRWRDLGVFPAPFDLPAVAAVWDVETAAAEDGLSTLVQQHLVEYEGGQYTLHDLLAELALQEPPADEVYYRHADYYLVVGSAADDLYMTEALAGLQAFDAALPHLLAACEWLARRGGRRADEWLANFPDWTAYVLNRRLKAADRIRLLNTALAAAQRTGDRRREGVHLGNLGLAYLDLGQVERAIAYHEQALAIKREIGDRRGEGVNLGNLGSAYYSLGQVERAIEYCEQALALQRETGDRRGESADLGNLGSAYRHLGQVERAIEYYEQALAISREIGDRRGEGLDLGNLGIAYRRLGQVERAIEYYEQALTILHEIGDRSGEATHSWNLGVLYESLGDLQRAAELMQVLVGYEREIGHANLAKHEAQLADVRHRAAEGAADRE